MSDFSENHPDSWEPLLNTDKGHQSDNDINNEDKNEIESGCQTNEKSEVKMVKPINELKSPLITQVDTLKSNIIEEDKNCKLGDFVDMKGDKNVDKKLFVSEKISLSKRNKKQLSIITNNIENDSSINENVVVSIESNDKDIAKVSPENDSTVNAKDKISTEDEVQSPSFLNNMFATFRSSSTSIDGSSTKTPNDQCNKNQIVSSPNIISHRRDNSISSKRKSSRNRKTSNDSSLFNLVNSPLQKAPQPVEIITHMHSNNSSHKDLNQINSKSQINLQHVQDNNVTGTNSNERTTIKPNDENYNKKKFVEEKYADTDYHYATVERDLEFHTLFSSISKDDRLIDDFSCALSRDFLYQGRLYISERSLCFNSNILGWVSKDILPMKDIRYLEKTSAAGLFPNAILIETDNEKVQFNNFISREQTFCLIKEVWSKNLIFADLDKDTFLTKDQNDDLQNDKRTSNDNEIPEDSSIDSILNEKIGANYIRHYRFKDDAKYVNDQPYIHNETLFPNDNEPNEYILKTVDLPCTPLQAYQIMFSDKNYSFLYDYLHSIDSSDIEEPTKYDEMNIRNYSFERYLNIPGGPKSTKCYAEDMIVNYDPYGYIMVISTTKTPNVTSGKAFSTKTKYMYRWSTKNNCQLQISYWLEWTGSSWFKKIIESGAKKNQIEATEKLSETLNNYIENNIIETDEKITDYKEFIESSPIVKMVSIKNDLENNINKNNPYEKISATSILLSKAPFIFLIIILIILLTINIWFELSMRRSILNIEKLLEMEKLPNLVTMCN